ncbi:MAG TPA: DUF3565 domain-containing protein [Gaiellaceae bacterium]|jgi:hypothetical protein|nr:DUF3565 domain-containing protein [Gaiellaceae bacterium]
MERTIVGFHEDDEGFWVAELSCGHNQHVRHRPPFELKPWVLADETRNARIGTERDCPLCDRGGEAACYAHLVCDECGAVLDGAGHRPGCSQAL